MPLTSKGEEIMSVMKKEYGAEKGEKVFYASRNKGTISGVDSFVVKSDMTDDDWTKLRSLLSKFFEEEEKEPEHREDAAPKGYNAARSELASLGVELKWNDEWEEFTVKKKGASGTGYHTDDLQDAISTGKTMARKDDCSRIDSAISRLDESNRMHKLNRVMGALDKLLGRKKRADADEKSVRSRKELAARSSRKELAARALREFRETLKIAESHYKDGMAYFSKGKFDDAEEEFDAVLRETNV